MLNAREKRIEIMARRPRETNEALLRAIALSNLTYEAFASAVRRVAAENGEDLSRLGRSHVAHWVAGSRPRGRLPLFIAEVVSRRVGHRVTVDEIGLRLELGVSGDDAGLAW